ncbi:PREDICTED: myoferlin-like [Acropora digitifera]|uniref:myoferlin-like n=1 Tax=Acropora digitifera TaxID=70779 RepID=UPI00077AE5B7|nr:PREDICTED: myoferlin-like [Acropora digitifera]
MLKVEVTGATNLPDVDKFSGKSDPYAVVRFQGQEQKTDVREDELNPTWNKEFQYDLNGQKLSPQETLLIKVKDYEKIAPNRLLGSATVPLKNLVRSKNNSLKIEVGLLDGEQRPTLVSYHPGMIAFPLSSVGEPFSFYVCGGYRYYLYSTVLSVVLFSNRSLTQARSTRRRL